MISPAISETGSAAPVLQPFLQNGNTAADGKQEDIPLRIVVELGIVLKNDQIHQPHHIVLKAGVPAVRQQGQSGKAPAQAALQKLLDAYAASRAAKGTYTAADPETRTSIRDGMGALAAALTVIVGGDGTPDNPGLDGITAGLRELAGPGWKRVWAGQTRQRGWNS